MLALLKTDATRQQSDKPSLPNIDWNQFAKLVRHHRVYPQLYAGWKDSELIPADVLQALQDDFNKNLFRMLRLSGEMERVCAALHERGIPSLMLKGPVLAKELYGDLSLRTSKDLDILVPAEDVEKAEQTLTDLGYAGESSFRRVFNWKWKFHHVSYTHPQSRIQVEIHWRLNSDMGKEPSFEELWSRRRTSSQAQSRVCLPGSEDLFMYLVSHGARHGWFRLRWLEDIDRIVSQGLDWGTLIPLMKRYGCLHLGGQALILASELLNTPVPREAKPMTAGRLPRELARLAAGFIRSDVPPEQTATAKDGARAYKRYLFALKTKRQKAFYLISQLYPSFRDAEALPLPKPLYFLYFPLRPFVWLWRQMRQQA